MPNIKDVAREAGVSTATVSRVLNTPEKVSRKTVGKVNAAIEKLEYSPEANHSAVYGAGTKRILVVLPDFRNSFMSDVISGINDQALKSDYTLMVAATDSMMLSTVRIDAPPDLDDACIRLTLERFSSTLLSTCMARNQFMSPSIIRTLARGWMAR